VQARHPARPAGVDPIGPRVVRPGALGSRLAAIAHRMLGGMSVPPVLRFLVVGGGAALLELGVFQVLVLVGLDPVVANVLSFAVGMTSSFLGYRLWSFAGDHSLPVAGQFGAYLTLALFNAATSSVMIHALVGAGAVPWVAKVSCMVLIACWNYLLLNRFVFRRRTEVTGAPSPPTSEAPSEATVASVDGTITTPRRGP
jgi:putative flippase GtrA